MEALLDCYEGTGDRTFLNAFEACYDYLRYHVGPTWDGGTVVGGYDWFGYDFNPEVVQHTNWDYGRNGKGFYNDLFAPGWTIASLWELYSPQRTVQFLQQRR